MSPYEIKPGMTVFHWFGIKTAKPISIPVEVLDVQKWYGNGYRVIYCERLDKVYSNGKPKYGVEGLLYFCRNHQLEPL